MSDLGVPPQQPTPGRVAPRNAKRRQVIVLVVLLVVTGGLLGGIWLATRSQPVNAKVGDCVHQTGSDSIAIVNCTDGTADFKVVGRVEDKTRSEAGYLSTVCDQYQGAERMFWQGAQDKKGYVLCLAPNAK
jgi:hypothetical protein